jgi:hypothetical protein
MEDINESNEKGVSQATYFPRSDKTVIDKTLGMENSDTNNGTSVHG